MKTLLVCARAPLREARTVDVTLRRSLPALAIEVRREAISLDREDELMRLALLQRLEHLRRCIEELRRWPGPLRCRAAEEIC